MDVPKRKGAFQTVSIEMGGKEHKFISYDGDQAMEH